MIHLIAAGKYQNQKDWPEIWNKCFDTIQKLNYPIKIWDDKAIDNEIKSDDEEFYNEYLSQLDNIYKYDYVRYIILERYGGVYMDLDVEVKMNFLSLLNPNKVYIAEGIKNCLVSNHIMISPPDFLFWNNIRQQLKYRLIKGFEKYKTSEYWTVEVFGPVGLSYIIAKDKIRYTPLSRYHFGSENTDLQFCIHHTTSKWTEGKKQPYKSYKVI